MNFEEDISISSPLTAVLYKKKYKLLDFYYFVYVFALHLNEQSSLLIED